jgi:hypothetical protein
MRGARRLASSRSRCTLKAAKKALKKAHCRLGKVKGAKTGRAKHQSRKRGTVLPAGTKVKITLG